MRPAWRISGAHGYTPEEFRASSPRSPAHDLSAWLHAALDTTEELDYCPARDRRASLQAEPRFRGPWIGLSTAATLRNENGRLVVAQVAATHPRKRPA